MPKLLKPLSCKTHGPHPWDATVVCDTCDRVWRLHNVGQKHAEQAPPTGPFCTCGAPLVRSAATPGREAAARAICEECFQERWRVQQTAVLH
jgi:hypothetical protein